MPYNNSNIVEEIKSRCDIVEVIGRVVDLKRAGANYKGLCPFHGEKTPSFVVSEQKQIFTCFGCGATGDVIEFVKRYYHLEFGEAVEKLANEYGIELKNNYSFAGSEKKEKLFQLNRDAARYFYANFRAAGNKGLKYMQNRGVDADTSRHFGIGYADESWDGLLKHMTGLGYDQETMRELGLLSKKDSRYYDKFRDRVIFPIINSAGKVIGFGGRALSSEVKPKYLNSDESAVYVKKSNLFGLNLAKQDISRLDQAIMVEGYMDMMALYQYGIRNVCASCGTALTENQAKLLKRYTTNVVLCYDSDAAGRNAALRGSDVLQNAGLKVKIMHVSNGKDPDEFVKSNGSEAFRKLVAKALPVTDYKLLSLRASYDMQNADSRIDYIKAAVKILKLLSPVEADVYIKKLAEGTGISVNAIKLEYENAHANVQQEQLRPPHSERNQIQEINNLEKLMLKLIIRNGTYLERISEEEFQSAAAKEIYKALAKQYKPGEDIDISMVSEELEFENGEVFKDIVDNIQIIVDDETVYNDCKRRIKLDNLKRTENELLQQLGILDDSDNETVINVQQRIKQVQNEIKETEGSQA